MTVSIAMIVRNEASMLPACLASLEEAEAELCIVDTGSEDDTPAIAEAFGARVESFPWCDDFAAARNAALELCTNPWVFVIDADERLAPGDAARLRALAEGAEPCGCRFTTRNYTANCDISEYTLCAPDDPFAEGWPGWYPSVKVRLFPNRPEFRFEGVVHEVVAPALVRHGLPIVQSDIPIHHYGLAKDPAHLERKARYYVELGLKKVQTAPEDSRAHAELGNQFAQVGDYARAAAAYREALRRDPENPVVLKDLGGALYLLGHREEAIECLRLAVRINADFLEGWRNLGVLYLYAGEWEAARHCFEWLVARAPQVADYRLGLRQAQERIGT